MRVALFSDVHGNLVSLEAVLADIAEAQVDLVVSLGDVAVAGPQPRQVIARLKALDCLCVMGNHDHELLDLETTLKCTDSPAIILEFIEWCAGQLTDTDLECLRAYRPVISVSLDNKTKLLCCHGSPRSNEEFILATTPTRELDQMLAGYTATVIACGHTHVQMLRRQGQTLLVNVGSVGWPLEEMPFNGNPRYLPWAEYAIIEASGAGLRVELRRVPIDLDAVKQAALDSDMPYARFWADCWVL
jgi:predicted phosphodiesterase